MGQLLRKAQKTPAEGCHQCGNQPPWKESERLWIDREELATVHVVGSQIQHMSKSVPLDFRSGEVSVCSFPHLCLYYGEQIFC